MDRNAHRKLAAPFGNLSVLRSTVSSLWDPRNIDVAVLSTLPIVDIRTHRVRLGFSAMMRRTLQGRPRVRNGCVL